MKEKCLLLVVLPILIFVFSCQQMVTNPIVNPSEGVFIDFVEVEISCATQGATIIYTLDGTNPSYQNGQKYINPIHIENTTTVKAFAYKEGMLDSDIVTEEYIIIEPIAIIEGNWVDGNISTGQTIWYSFDALGSTSYEIFWDDANDGSSSCSSDIKVSAYKGNLKDCYFLSQDNGFTNPPVIFSENQQKIYIKIEINSLEGTFKIKFNKTTTKYTNIYDNITEGITENFAPNESYTFMMYMAGDNDLEKWMIYDFLEMVNGLNGLDNPNVKVVVLLDRIDGYYSSNNLGEPSDWTGTRLYQINQDGTYTKKTDGWFTDGSELNMGNPQTLKSFISYCQANYASSHYVLFLFNHGSGTRTISENLEVTINKTNKAVCWDVTDSNDWLYDYEVKDAIDDFFNSANKLDMLCYHACLMGSIEVAYEYKDCVKYITASPAKGYSDMMDFVNLFKGMEAGSNSDAKELAKLIVKTTAEYAISKNRTNYTYSAYDLSKLSEIKALIDNLAVKIFNENKKREIERLRDFSYHYYWNDDDSVNFPFVDLNDFLFQIISNNSIFSQQLVDAAQSVLNKLAEIIIAAYAGIDYGNYYGSGTSVKRGISIFFSRGNLIYDGKTHYASQIWYRTNYIDFANYNSNGIVETWRELFEAWYDPNNSYTPGTY